MVFILTLIIIAVDQITKYLAIDALKGSSAKVIIPDFFRLVYVENYGAAFGILQNKKIFFVIITIAVVIGLILFLMRYYNRINLITKLSIATLLGGTIGNFIDRVRFGYVVDFFSFRLFNFYEFPVFNIADIAIVISTILIVYLLLFDKYEYRRY